MYVNALEAMEKLREILDIPGDKLDAVEDLLYELRADSRIEGYVEARMEGYVEAMEDNR